MVTVALLSFIIIGLVAMFGQTRRAFTSSMTQVDVLEAGRSAGDIMTREIEQIAAVGSPNVVNFFVDSPITRSNINYLYQSMADTNESRTNNLEEVFFTTRYNQTWTGIGYKLTNYLGGSGIGTLFRYSTAPIANTNNYVLSNQFGMFTNINLFTNMTRMIDGVVDFRIRVYDPNGNRFPTALWPLTQQVTGLNSTVVTSTNFMGDLAYCSFTSNSVPAYVEIELGVLEDRTLARYTALAASGGTGPGSTGPGSTAWAYLTNHAGNVHIFRQRITVRNVNPLAYQ